MGGDVLKLPLQETGEEKILSRFEIRQQSTILRHLPVEILNQKLVRKFESESNSLVQDLKSKTCAAGGGEKIHGGGGRRRPV